MPNLWTIRPPSHGQAQLTPQTPAAWQDEEAERERQPTGRPCIIHQVCISLGAAGQGGAGSEGTQPQTEPDRDTPQLESFMKVSTSGRALITSWIHKAWWLILQRYEALMWSVCYIYFRSAEMFNIQPFIKQGIDLKQTLGAPPTHTRTLNEWWKKKKVSEQVRSSYFGHFVWFVCKMSDPLKPPGI